MATISVTKGYEWTSGETVTPTKLNSGATPVVSISGIVNADIASNAAIADSKLATISTAAKVSNSATTATSANTASAIVARDASGNFSAGTITASLTGNVTGNVTGNLTGTASAVADGAVTAAKLSGAQTGAAPIFGVRAWAKFAGQGSNGACVVSASGNVTSVTRISSGIYEVVMTTALPDANYAIFCTSTGTVSRLEGFTETATTFRVELLDLAGTAINPAEISVMAIR
jgi:hypothetical protein